MIHETALVETGARIDPTVRVGPYTVIGSDVTLEPSVTIGAHVVLDGKTEIGAETRISDFVAIGQPPQDIHDTGEQTRITIGKRCWIREFATLHRGTQRGGGLTRIGNDCLLMAYTHVAHDCRVGDRVTMANGATLAGHVEIQDAAVIGGLTAIHQFARVGRYAIVGGASAVSMDVTPYASVAGNRTRVRGVNVIGLRRSGFSEESITTIRKAHRILFRSALRLEQAIERLEEQFSGIEEVQCLIEFIQTSQRGLCR